MDELPGLLRHHSPRYTAVPEDAIELKSAKDFAPKTLCLPEIRPAKKALRVRTACLVVLGFSYLAALAAIAMSMYMIGSGTTPYDLWFKVIWISPVSRRIADLALSVVVTLCTEAMGYIHSISLRWALYREHRLHYSSNLRLLKRAHRSWPNSLWANFLCAIGLVLSYVGASQTFIPFYRDDSSDPGRNFVALLNGPSLLFLGIGLGIQALLSTACIIKDSGQILTWSSSPLTVALACLQAQDSPFQHQEDRCLQSAFDSLQGHTSNEPLRPRLQQPSLRLTDPPVRHITRFIWTLAAAAVLWASAVTVLVFKLPEKANHDVGNGYFPYGYRAAPCRTSYLLSSSSPFSRLSPRSAFIAQSSWSRAPATSNASDMLMSAPPRPAPVHKRPRNPENTTQSPPP